MVTASAEAVYCAWARPWSNPSVAQATSRHRDAVCSRSHSVRV